VITLKKGKPSSVIGLENVKIGGQYYPYYTATVLREIRGLIKDTVKEIPELEEFRLNNFNVNDSI
jgi:hypothetical protein